MVIISSADRGRRTGHQRGLAARMTTTVDADLAVSAVVCHVAIVYRIHTTVIVIVINMYLPNNSDFI